MPAETKQTERQRGSIAILALWGIALIFMLIAPVAFATRGEVQIARNALAESRARLAAEGGTQLGLLQLLHDSQSGPAHFDGTAKIWQQGSTRVAIVIRDEAGKIDLNLAPLEMIGGLFAAVGAPKEAAALIACNVVAYRGDTGTDCPQPDVPQAARLFTVPEQLAEIPGVSEQLYDRVADDVTVASGASAIDPTVASRDVLLAIPGATAGMVDAFLETRAALHDFGSSLDASLIPPAAAPFLAISPARNFTISATAATIEGARYRADLQVRLTDRAAQPYQVVAWRTPPVDRGGPAQPTRTARVP